MDDQIADVLADITELRDSIALAITWFGEEYDQLVDVSYPDPNTIIIKLTDEDNIATCPKCEEVYDKKKGCCEIA